MPKWSEYKAISKERGSLAMELFIVQTRPIVAPEIMKEVLPAHLAYQKEMENAGHLVLAGPISDETGEEMQGSGMIIYRAKDLDEARSIADGDPMHAQKARTYEIRKWLVNEGSLSFSISLSSQSVKIG